MKNGLKLVFVIAVVAIGAILSLLINKSQHTIETMELERYAVVSFDDFNKAAGVSGGTITISLDGKIYTLEEYDYHIAPGTPKYHICIVGNSNVIITTDGKEHVVPVVVKDSYPPVLSVKYQGELLKDGDTLEVYQHEIIDDRFVASAYEQYNESTIPLLDIKMNAYPSTETVGKSDIIWTVSDGMNETQLTIHLEVIENSEGIGFNKDNVMELTNPSIETALVNRKRALPQSYVPDLVEIPADYAVSEGYRATQATSMALQSLIDAMYDEVGLWMFVTSSYRNYDLQEELYTNYVAQHGQEEADRMSARPGTSEHQTGLVIDVVTPGGVMDLFKDTEQSKWVNDNAHRFGFIIRYPEGKESITGYMPEAWHLRYVGEEVAEKVYQSGVTYDEWYHDNFLIIEAGRE